MQIGISSRPKPGEIECGDQYAVVEIDQGVLIAVADGLGHGPAAAQAARAACRFVSDNATVEIESLMLACSKAISATRGVAMTLLRIQTADCEMSYAGVGNVELRSLARKSISSINTPGIVGRRLARVKKMVCQLNPGDLLVLYTDGISSKFDLNSYAALDVQAIADKILKNFAKAYDDATCAVIRYETIQSCLPWLALE